MKCPICNIDLQMTERQGIEIDYCSKCRGVWLDRGELDKLIEKTNAVCERPTSHHEPPRLRQDHFREEPRHDHYDRPHHDEYHYKKKHRREGFLGDLFDL